MASSYFKTAKALGASDDFAKNFNNAKRIEEFKRQIERFGGKPEIAEYVMYGKKKGYDASEYFTKKELKEFKQIMQKEYEKDPLKKLTSLEKHDLNELIKNPFKNANEIVNSLLEGRPNKLSAGDARQEQWAKWGRDHKYPRAIEKLAKRINVKHRPKFKANADYGYAVVYNMRTKGISEKEAKNMIKLGKTKTGYQLRASGD